MQTPRPYAGIYVLRLTASDGDLVTFDEVTITANPALVVSNLQVASGKAYQVVPNGLTNGAEVYIDRSYTFTTVPVIMEGATFLRTANGDKRASEAAFLSFSVNQNVTVYVAYDVRAKSLPDWLANWTNTGEVLGTTDVSRDLYAKDFPAGTVILGGNLAAGASGAKSNYNVIIDGR